MGKYGLTPNGPNIKRLDVILTEMHEGLSKEWGVNTRQNPQSVINHILTNIADRIAELWEFGESVYYAGYPSSAEGISLDNVAQIGGSLRKTAVKSFYPLHCTGIEGTILAIDTKVSSNTNPATILKITESKTLSRDSFNKATIRLVEALSGNLYEIRINEKKYEYVSTSDNPESIFSGIKDSITDKNFDFQIFTTEDGVVVLEISCKDITANNKMSLSPNLTTETVTSIINFGTEEAGDILIPMGAISNIVKADAGLRSVTNLCSYIAGRNDETDSEFRKSYADKIFNRSSMMIESIKSAILENVQGVKSVEGYENHTNEQDGEGRPPHSIEIVVDGGDNTKIAQEILNYKAAGISTFGSIEIPIPGKNEEEIIIRFNRPEEIRIKLTIDVYMKQGETISDTQTKMIKDISAQNITNLGAGEDVVPQMFVSKLYEVCSGISYIEMNMEYGSDKISGDEAVLFGEYHRSVTITPRQKAVITADMIEVRVNE